MIPVFYKPAQSIRTKSYSPSPSKPSLVVESWKEKFPALRYFTFPQVTPDDLKLAHSPEYVDGVMSLALPNGFGSRSQNVRDSLPHTVGSMVAATLRAYKDGGVAVSPTSGFHHAGYSSGGGFCTFNGLVIAAMKAHEAGAKRVTIIDCDMHYGDGTADIKKKLNLTWLNHWSAGKHYGDSPKDESKFLMTLHLLMHAVTDISDVVIYQAGADPHVDDPLGGWLSTEGMRVRDQIVFSVCKERGIPLAWNLAGGYQTPISKVIALHDNTMQECVKTYL